MATFDVMQYAQARVERCIGCPSPSETTISVKARFAFHSGARGGIPLPVETDLDRHRYAALAPYPMRATSRASSAVTPRLGIVRCDSRWGLSTLRGRAVRPKSVYTSRLLAI